jgi:hypothetical protein
MLLYGALHDVSSDSTSLASVLTHSHPRLKKVLSSARLITLNPLAGRAKALENPVVRNKNYDALQAVMFADLKSSWGLQEADSQGKNGQSSHGKTNNCGIVNLPKARHHTPLNNPKSRHPIAKNPKPDIKRPYPKPPRNPLLHTVSDNMPS